MKAAAWHPSGKGLVLSLQAYLDVSVAKVGMATGKLPAGLIFSNFECMRTMFSSDGHRVSVFEPADAVDATRCDIACHDQAGGQHRVLRCSVKEQAVVVGGELRGGLHKCCWIPGTSKLVGSYREAGQDASFLLDFASPAQGRQWLGPKLQMPACFS